MTDLDEFFKNTYVILACVVMAFVFLLVTAKLYLSAMAPDGNCEKLIADGCCNNLDNFSCTYPHCSILDEFVKTADEEKEQKWN